MATTLNQLVILLLSVLTIALAVPRFDPAEQGYLSFTSCNDDLECGYILVPKNYEDPSHGFANLSLTRKRASEPKNGTVFINPGGPGVPGANWVADNIDYLVDHIGSQWDIVGFDPRGVGESTPGVNCFETSQDMVRLYTNTVFEQGYTLPNMNDIDDPANFPALVELERQHITVFRAISEACKSNMKTDDLRFMGTTSVARDVDFMARVLDGEDGKINFYGYSYGTVLGQFILNMFPDRIGSFTLDGVVDPIAVTDKYTSEWSPFFQQDAEKAYQDFLEGCSASGPTGCALAKSLNEDPDEIGKRIDDFTQTLVEEPLAVGGGEPGFITAGAIRNLWVNTLYMPNEYPFFAADLALAMAGDGTNLLDDLRTGTVNQAGDDAARYAIVCADSPRSSSLSLEDYADSLLDAMRRSRFAGGLIFTDPDGGCEFWPVEPIERFTGPFDEFSGANDARPVLIISNTKDPITPLENGLAANARMPYDSIVVIQDGPGHTSLGLPSDCTRDQIRAYWSGETPTNGTLCELSEIPWPAPPSEEQPAAQQPALIAGLRAGSTKQPQMERRSLHHQRRRALQR